MANRNACIVGGGQSKWGVREAHLVDLFQEAGKACLDDIPGLKPKDIDGLIVATSYSGRCSFQVNTAPVVAERLVRKGYLPELFSLLDNTEERTKDREGFAVAKAEFLDAQAEIAVLESGKGREDQTEKLGQQAAAVASVVIALLTLTILLVIRVW